MQPLQGLCELLTSLVDARVVFETCVNRLISKPETLPKVKPLYSYFHKYEAQYGELLQITKLEERMAELFPEDPKLQHFIARFSSEVFDPLAASVVVSKAVQMRPKQVAAAREKPASVQGSPAPIRHEQSPRPQYARATASPKRPFGIDEDEPNPPKRLARGLSPLKGAAGRRLDQQRRNQAAALHRDITFLLGILPPAQSYDAQRLSPSGVVNLLLTTQIPDYNTWRSNPGAQRLVVPPHSTQPSAEYANRPASPFGRVAVATGAYRNSPLRVESSGHAVGPYVPADAGSIPTAWAPGAAPSGYGQLPPGQYGTYRF